MTTPEPAPPQATMRPGAVELYCDRPSYAHGETVAIHASSALDSLQLEVARLGDERELVARVAGVRPGLHALPEDAASHGCVWPVAATLTLDSHWRSGCYEVLLSGADGSQQGRGFFALRPRAGDPPRPLLLLATTTYDAYNNWGGPNLYQGATCVSTQRPLAAGFLHRDADVRLAPVGRAPDPDRHAWLEAIDRHGLSYYCGSAGWFNWERRFVAWAERAGHPLDVAVGSDLQFHPEVLDGRRLVLSVGHDEYWSWEMRDTLEGFIDAGGNAAFFSGNAVCWQVRLEDEGRTMRSWKQTAHACDPVVGTDRERRMTGLWSDPLIGRPETQLTGVSFNRGGYARVGGSTPRASGGYTIARPEHWAFARTGLRYGDVLGASDGVVGYEVDGCELALRDGRPVPTHADGCPAGFEVLATAPARLWDHAELPAVLGTAPGELSDIEFVAARLLGDSSPRNVERLAYGHAVMGAYERGGTVFTCGSTDWSYGLDGPDPLIASVTHNVLTRLSAGP